MDLTSQHQKVHCQQPLQENYDMQLRYLGGWTGWGGRYTTDVSGALDTCIRAAGSKTLAICVGAVILFSLAALNCWLFNKFSFLFLCPNQIYSALPGAPASFNYIICLRWPPPKHSCKIRYSSWKIPLATNRDRVVERDVFLPGMYRGNSIFGLLMTDNYKYLFFFHSKLHWILIASGI